MKFQMSLLVFLLSAIVTAAFWAVLPQSWRVNESSDFIYYYDPVARQILGGKGLTLPSGDLALRYPPGYPAVLVIVLGISNSLGISQATAMSAWILVCTSLSSTLLFLLASRVFDLQTGLISALLWITYPFQLWLTKQPNSEIPFMVFIFASVFLFWRFMTATSPHFVGLLTVGLLAGTASLVRPIAIGMAGIFIGFLFLQTAWRLRSRLIGVVAILVGSLAVILPWETWVYSQTQRIIPLSTGGAPSVWDGLTYAVDDERVIGSVPARANDLMISLLNRSKGQPAITFSGLLTILGEEAARNPQGAVQLLCLKAARSWYGTDSGRLELTNVIVQGVYLIAIVWGGLAIWQSDEIKRRYLVFVVILMLYFWLMTLSALSILRYMVPIMGLLITLIPAGVWRFPGAKAILNRWMPLK